MPGVAKRNTPGVRRYWYTRFGIKAPFPWLLLTLWASLVLIVIAGVAVGISPR